MLRSVSVLVIKMNKGTLNLWQKLELLLQGLTDVMGLLQGHACWQHNVNLHKVVRPKCVSSDCVNMSYGLVVVPAEVRELL